MDVFVLSSTKQEIHATIKECSNNLSWLLSSIYASPRLVERRILWSNRAKVAQLHTLPWLLLGDFNEILSGEDKFGGRNINLNRALDFKGYLDASNILDLGFFGLKYTWSNQRKISNLILEMIDRCFANPTRRLLYPEASVTHLHRVFSYHYPVLMELCNSLAEVRNKPFRFQSMWMLHLDFPRAIKESWGREQLLTDAISGFTRQAKQWNVNVFGNLFARKRRVLARINGAQKALSNNPSDFLIQLEKNLIEEYNLIMPQKEEFWALKSHLNWATFRDRNTSFFHVSTILRGHRNKIRSIKDNLREWITKEEGVKEFILTRFKLLYTTDFAYSTTSFEVSQFSCCHLSEKNKRNLCSNFSEEEIKTAIWALKPFKTLGPNGLHARFF